MENKSKVFAVQHSLNVRVGVTYEEKGLVVSVYREDNLDKATGKIIPQRFRYWNPSEVTKWFEENSKANLESWRKAYHDSGLTGTDFERPEEKKVIVDIDYRDIEYFSQRDNKLDPMGACNVTSYAMVMEFFGIKTIETKYKQYEDNLNYYMKQRGLSRHTHDDLVKMARAHGADATFKTSQSLEDIREALSKGILVVLSGKFTSSGHIISVIGKKGKDFYVNDPFGSVLDHYETKNGSHLIYSESVLKKYAIDKRPGSGAWAHYIKGRLDN